MRSEKQLSPDETEALLPFALENWARETRHSDQQQVSSRRLADAIETNHNDTWFRNLIDGPSSERGNRLLLEAIGLNHSGDADHAWKAAVAAESAFRQRGNTAGMLRSSVEQIYALRRKSRARECLEKGSSVQSALRSVRYYWIEAQTAMELSSCEVMANHPDRSRAFSAQALKAAAGARYANLHLRALALQGNLDMHEGRSQATWRGNETGLGIFWQGAYPDERAFQFYHDLQFDSESGALDYLALLLQRETLSMIAGHTRYDFEAMAHFRMAEAQEALGNSEQAWQELSEYQSFISRLPISSDARSLYQAYCDVGFARLALRSGSKSEAASRLGKASPLAATADNASLRLEYLQTLSKYHRVSLETRNEEQDLRNILALVQQEFVHTISSSDRWHMRRAVDSARRRLLEISLQKPHDSLRTFAEWHRWRSLENAPLGTGITSPTPEAWARAQLRHMQSRALLSFAVLPNATVAWVVNDSGIHELVIPIESGELFNEVRHFYLLCSDPNSDIQKVKASGSRLYRVLVAPLEQELGTTQRIVIAADSLLGFIPWVALRTPSGAYWGHTRSITIHTGFSSGIGPHAKSNRIRRMVIATPGAVATDDGTYLPLVHADEEASYVSSFFPNSRRLRSGEASPSRLMRELLSAEGLHFAGHALNRGEEGELVTDKEEEGGAVFLTAKTLRDSPMPKLRLVVLSACSAASPENSAEDNPDGLVRAFVLAGAPIVVASRWDVDSHSTALLMKDFYWRLSGGQSASEALRNAGQALALQKAFEHPYYWSAFQVFGPN